MAEDSGSGSCDLLIAGGTVIDGSGAPGLAADVAVTEGRIAAVGDLAGWTAATRQEADGRVVAPGFIDVHTHDDRLLLSDPTMTPKASQGVTTVVTGNCGVSLAPMTFAGDPPPPLNLLGDKSWYRFTTLADYFAALEAAPPAINYAQLVGHASLRVSCMSELDRPATSGELDAMQGLLDEALGAGAIGLSTGLAYKPAISSSTDEVAELAGRLADHGGLYTTHMRDEGDHIIEAMDEAFEIGRRGAVPAVISHFKCCGRDNWGRAKETVAHLEAQRQRQTVDADVYPYVASSTVLEKASVHQSVRVTITWSQSHPEMNGRDLHDIAAEWDLDLDAAADRLQPAGAVYYQMDEADLIHIMTKGGAMIGSDGLPHDAHPHPRLWGTFPRVLGHFSRERGLFPLEEALHRMTGLPAAVFGFKDRGLVRQGAIADLVVFDPETILDRATFEDPMQPAAGIDAVLVAGEAVWTAEGETGARPGRQVRRT